MATGCLAIGKAISESTESSLEVLDFSDISVNKEFTELKLNETFPNLKIITGGSWVQKAKKKPRMDPMTMLKTYMDQQNLRLVDFFNKLDTDGSMSLRFEFFVRLMFMQNVGMIINALNSQLGKIS